MKKLLIKLCCILLVMTIGGESAICNNTTYAADNINKSINETALLRVENDNNTEVLDEMLSMLNVICNDSMNDEYNYDYIKIGDYVSVYNADANSIFYIYPIFADDECILTAQVGDDGNVCLSSDISMYNSMCEELESNSPYILYVDDGSYYAQDKYETIELENIGFVKNEIESEFADYSYSEKLENIIDNVDSAIELTEIPSKDSILESVDVSEDNSDEVAGAVSTTIGTSLLGKSIKTVKCNIGTFVLQGNYSLCWAASIATIVNYKKGGFLTAKSVADKMGIAYSAGGTLAQIKSAFSIYGLSYSTTTSKLSWAQVKTNIVTDKPFCIWLNRTGGAHLITGYGYGCDSADIDSALRVIYAWDSNNYKLFFGYNATTITTSGNTYTWTKSIY